MANDSFVFYESFYETIQLMPKEQQLAAYQALIEYALHGEEANTDGMVSIFMSMAKSLIDKPKFYREFIPRNIKDSVIESDSGCCHYCGKKGIIEYANSHFTIYEINNFGEKIPFEIDHFYPYILGGTNDEENLRLSCRACNRSKGSKTLAEWRGSRGEKN